MSRRTLVASLAAFGLALAIAALAGLGTGTGTAAPHARQLSGTVSLFGWQSSPVEDNLLRQVVKDFEKKHPKIKVNYTAFGGDYDQTMLARFAARKPPDVFYVNGHVFPVWVPQGVLASLSPYVKKYHFSTKPFFPRLLNAFKYKGQYYGFPKDWGPLAMFVNTDMLKKAGAKVPTTWATLRSTAQKLKSSNAVPGGTPICLSDDWARLFAFAYQNGYKGGILRSSSITGSAVRGAANYYVGLWKSGLAKRPADVGASWNGDGFMKGKCAIAFEGTWLIPPLKTTAPNIHYKIAPLPKGKTRGNLAFTVSYSIAKDSKHKALAWTLLTYLTGKVGIKKWTSLGLALPSRKDVKAIPGRAVFLNAAPYSHVWQGGSKFNDVITAANNELSAVAEGKESVSSMLSKIKTAAKNAGQ
jgi:multiple sugar transport system substrate-binding protein